MNTTDPNAKPEGTAYRPIPKTRKQKSMIGISVQTDPWEPKCKLCLEREKLSKMSLSNNWIDINEYVRAVNYVNQIHYSINSSLANQCRTASVIPAFANITDVPHILTVVNSQSNDQNCKMVSKSTSTESLYAETNILPQDVVVTKVITDAKRYAYDTNLVSDQNHRISKNYIMQPQEIEHLYCTIDPNQCEKAETFLHNSSLHEAREENQCSPCLFIGDSPKMYKGIVVQENIHNLPQHHINTNNRKRYQCIPEADLNRYATELLSNINSEVDNTSIAIEKNNSGQQCDLEKKLSSKSVTQNTSNPNDVLKTKFEDKMNNEIMTNSATILPLRKSSIASIIKESEQQKTCSNISKNCNKGNNSHNMYKENITNNKSKLTCRSKLPVQYREISPKRMEKSHMPTNNHLNHYIRPSLRTDSKVTDNKHYLIQQKKVNVKKCSPDRAPSTDSIIISDPDSNHNIADSDNNDTDDFFAINRKHQNKTSSHSIHSQFPNYHSKIPKVLLHKGPSQLTICRTKKNVASKQNAPEHVAMVNNIRNCLQPQYLKHRQRGVSESSNCSRSTISSDNKSERRSFSSHSDKQKHQNLKHAPSPKH